jgi:hypothetical protein
MADPKKGISLAISTPMLVIFPKTYRGTLFLSLI